MLFNTWTFVVFLAVTFTAYHFLSWPERQRIWWQIALLTVASYVFYAWHTPWLVIILAASTWINAYVTLKLVPAGAPPEERKRWVTFAIVANLGVLIFFKYASLVVGTFLSCSWWSHWGFDLTQIPLPVGISFFTFQGISLVVDVYRKPSVVLTHRTDVRGSEFVVHRSDSETQVPETRNEALETQNQGLSTKNYEQSPAGLFFRVAFFKAFFPQLVAGPIVKAHEFMHQIGGKTFASIDWEDAVKKLILGFFLKMVVADNLRESTAGLHYPEFVGGSGLNLLFMLYGFSFQIFADFAGYSLIAIGLARLFGYQLPINFSFPYISQSITEFWRRWHISLSTWLREYLYIPLGGNRKGSLRMYFNLILVMLLGGLWHGAAWSFMVWGGAHGVCLALERFFGVKGTNEGHRDFRFSDVIISAFRIFLIFNLVSFLWLLFQLSDFKDAVLYLKELAAWKTKGNSPQIFYAVAVFGLPVIAYHLWGLLRPRYWKPFAIANPLLSTRLINAVYAILLFLIVTNSGNPGAFIYFQF
jgi:alginate O-acetyltransferase complex protein AlgI